MAKRMRKEYGPSEGLRMVQGLAAGQQRVHEEEQAKKRELIKTYLQVLLNEAKRSAFEKATPEQIKLAFPGASMRIQ